MYLFSGLVWSGEGVHWPHLQAGNLGPMVEKTTGPGYVKREGQEAEEMRPRAPQGSAFPGESLPLLQREKAVPIQMAMLPLHTARDLGDLALSHL